MLIQKYFGRQVLSRTTKRVRQFVRAQVRFGETKVTERYVTRSIEQDVLRFQVATLPVSPVK